MTSDQLAGNREEMVTVYYEVISHHLPTGYSKVGTISVRIAGLGLERKP